MPTWITPPPWRFRGSVTDYQVPKVGWWKRCIALTLALLAAPLLGILVVLTAIPATIGFVWNALYEKPRA